MQRLRAACASASLPSHNALQNKNLHKCLKSASLPHNQLCLKIFLPAVLHKELGNAQHLGWKRSQKLLCPPSPLPASPPSPPPPPGFYTKGRGPARSTGLVSDPARLEGSLLTPRPGASTSAFAGGEEPGSLLKTHPISKRREPLVLRAGPLHTALEQTSARHWLALSYPSV